MFLIAAGIQLFVERSFNDVSKGQEQLLKLCHVNYVNRTLTCSSVMLCSSIAGYIKKAVAGNTILS